MNGEFPWKDETDINDNLHAKFIHLFLFMFAYSMHLKKLKGLFYYCFIIIIINNKSEATAKKIIE